MLLYEWTYGLDAYGYFNASLQAAPPSAIGFSDGTANMRGIAWLVARVLPNSYHALKVFFSLVGMLGIFLIYRAATRIIGRNDPRALYVIGLFPSCLFWSSILGKDPVQLLGIGLYVYGVVNAFSDLRPRYVLVAAAGLVLSMFIRLWSGPILVLPLVVFPLMSARSLATKAVVTGIFAAVFVFAVVQVADRFRLETVQDVVNIADKLSQSAGWEGGSTIRSSQELSSPGTLIAFAPVAMFTALFRPLPGEVRGLFGIIAGLENGVLIALVGIALVKFRRRLLRDPIVLWSMLLVLGWSAVYGVSVYNLGTIVRFKLQILPILLLLIMHLAGFGDANRLKPANERN
jgi:hypothetical protein